MTRGNPKFSDLLSNPSKMTVQSIKVNGTTLKPNLVRGKPQREKSTSQNHIISDSNLQKIVHKIIVTNPSNSNKQAILKFGLSLFEDSEEKLKNKARKKFVEEGVESFICFVASRASRNAREGHYSVNSGIGKLFDPMLDSQGKPTPQQEYVVDQFIELSQVVTRNDDGTRNKELFNQFLDVLTPKCIRSRDGDGKIHTGVVSSSNSITPHLMKKRDFSVIDSSCFDKGRTSVNINQLITVKHKKDKRKTPVTAANNNLIFHRVSSVHR